MNPFRWIWNLIKYYWFYERWPCFHAPYFCILRFLGLSIIVFFLLSCFDAQRIFANYPTVVYIAEILGWVFAGLTVLAIIWLFDDTRRFFIGERLRYRRLHDSRPITVSWPQHQEGDDQVIDIQPLVPSNLRIQREQEIQTRQRGHQGLGTESIRFSPDPFPCPSLSYSPSYPQLCQERGNPEFSITSPSGSITRFGATEQSNFQDSTLRSRFRKSQTLPDFRHHLRRRLVKSQQKKRNEYSPLLPFKKTPFASEEISSHSSPYIPFIDEANTPSDTQKKPPTSTSPLDSPIYSYTPLFPSKMLAISPTPWTPSTSHAKEPVSCKNETDASGLVSPTKSQSSSYKEDSSTKCETPMASISSAKASEESLPDKKIGCPLNRQTVSFASWPGGSWTSGPSGGSTSGPSGGSTSGPSGGSTSGPSGGSTSGPSGGSTSGPSGGSTSGPSGGSARGPSGGSARGPSGGSARGPSGGSATGPSGGSPVKTSDSSPENLRYAPLASISELQLDQSPLTPVSLEAPRYPQKRKRGSKFASDSDEEIDSLQLNPQSNSGSPTAPPPRKRRKMDKDSPFIQI